MATDHLDEIYERLHRTGPEFDGWLSNHAPMAADALARIGRGERVDGWLDGYLPRLEERPGRRWPINEVDWRDALGEPVRLGDWIGWFSDRLREQPWRDVLTEWWPRLLPGGIASATHPLIRTGHVVRALGEEDTTARREELAHALGYWAARWQPLPGGTRPAGQRTALAALDAVPAIGGDGGIRERIVRLPDAVAWPAAQAGLRPLTDPAEVPGALDALVDATVSRYPAIAHGNPVMLVHASTAPCAARLALAALPERLWVATYDTAWSIAAAITAIYTPATAAPPPARGAERTAEEIAERAATNGDEHLIKFSEVALESHRRGNRHALPAAARAHQLLTAH